MEDSIADSNELASPETTFQAGPNEILMVGDLSSPFSQRRIEEVQMRLEDKVAIVTGGGGGMGSGICGCLAREGADIVVSDLELERAEKRIEEISKLGRRGLAVKSDVTREDDCRALMEEALQTFGQVDILVNNAGHFGNVVGAPFTQHTEAEWDDNFAVHVKGPFFLSKALAPHMMERKSGKIINISSIAAKRDPQFVPAYAAAKNALLNLTRLMAKDLGPHNINVNAVCPGFVWTNFWHRLAPLLARDNPAYEGMEARAMYDDIVIKNTPLGRDQSPEDIGNLVVFLASEEACNITGQTICVDGGLTMG